MKWISLYLEGVQIAWRSLLAHRLRTTLTVLGVAIGIFAITIIFTLVNSLNYNLQGNLNRLGNSALFVQQFPWTSETFDNWQKFIKRPRVSYNEFQKLERNLEGVDGVAYDVSGGVLPLKYRGDAVRNVSLHCTAGPYLEMNDWQMGLGRPFSEVESESGRAVCVLGSSVAENLFAAIPPLGKTIQMKGRRLKVIGVIEKTGANIFGNSPDDQVHIPYTFATKFLNVKKGRYSKVIMVKARNPKAVDQVENRIMGLMRSARGLRPKVENNFSVNRPAMMADLLNNITQYLWYGGLFISFFAVVVGGFGIGNIMFTTVKERTFEIGLQKALGARRNFILFQFLMESIMLCLMGGVVGLSLNYGLAELIQVVIDGMEVDFQIVVSRGSILFGVILSLVIGLGSGLIPSTIASKMDAVESMRS